jgi:hypothetical protein
MHGIAVILARGDIVTWHRRVPAQPSVTRRTSRYVFVFKYKFSYNDQFLATVSANVWPRALTP